MEARLQKILSQWGIASRRQAEEMIRHKRVQVNGNVAHLGQKVNPETADITVDGESVSAIQRPELMYILVHKPTNYVSTCYDPQGRRTVLDLLPQSIRSGQGIHPVGRLDADSTGALILTNDGDLTFHLTHPSHSISKTYHVLVAGHPPFAVLKMWREGVILDNRKTRTATVKVIKTTASATGLEIVLKEGRNRQIRRVAEKLGYPVIKLHRTAIGSITLHSGRVLHEGDYRYLQANEIQFLRSSMTTNTY